MSDWKDFTVENNIYKGRVSSYTFNYKSLGEILWTKIKSHRDQIAHLDVCTEQVVTYAELQDKVVRCALWLQEQGIKAGDVVSLCTHDHLNSFVPSLAAAYINAIFNPWDDKIDLQIAVYFMQLTTPKVIFCNEKSVNIILSAKIESNCNPIVVVFGEHLDVILFSDILRMYSDAEVTNFRYVELDDIKKTACILFSSGTTGMPKGIELSNYSLLLTSYYKEGMSAFNKAELLWFSPLYWIIGTQMNLIAILYGKKVILCPEFNEEVTCRLIEKYKVTLIVLSISMVSRFYKADYVKKYSLSSLKVILCGGAILKAKSLKEMRRILPHVQILQCYGITELAGAVTMQLPHYKNGSSGTVTENVQIKVVDPENGQVLGPNKSGELWIKTATIMNGYYKNPEATKSTIDEEGWLHSGDIGYFDEDGELFIIDRIKEFIRYRGYKISPGEIENVLTSHPAVLEVAVIGVPCALDHEHPVAYVTKIPEAKVTEQELIDLVANNMLDPYKLRAGVIFLDTFPYTASGKISRKELKAMAKQLENLNK